MNCNDNLPSQRWRRFLLVVWFVVLGATFAVRQSAAQEIDFNRDIRPLLSENCFYCHGQDGNKRQAGLRLDVREDAIDGGAIVPSDLDASLLIERIDTDDVDMMMPPIDSNRHLTADQKALLRQWIAEGAQYSEHWAFVKPERPEEPAVRNEAWVRNPIDRFVLAKLERQGLEPSPEADRETLIRRLSIDLIGLPPTPEEVKAFVSDTDPKAYEKVVERLLASPHYGERMALPWLDAARYADSNGFQQDGDTWQWIWRDWVVDALNKDMPFDQFTIWQLAGDLLPDATESQKIASAFNRNHMLNGEGGAIAEEQRFVNLFDRIDTTATTWLGLTVACAQCHDHKYDPITMRDYYQLMDAFNRVPETGTPQFFSKRIRVGRPLLELPTEENLAKIKEFEDRINKLNEELQPHLNALFRGWREGVLEDGNAADVEKLAEPAKQVLAKPDEERSEEEKSLLARELRKYFDQEVRSRFGNDYPQIKEIASIQKDLASYRAEQIPRVMIMSDDQPRETHILNRGQYLEKLEPVSFDTPAFLPDLAEDQPRNRLGLANWLVSSEHPLTARVQANRMWQYFFGNGIVKTSEDFGVQSEYPQHKDLLDWLAVEFQDNGWSMKSIHRLIVTSATYRQTSNVSEELYQLDPENRLYARASRFRMPSMILRDWALATSGLLNDEVGGAPVYPYQPDAVWEALAITKERDFTYPNSTGADLYRRSLYTFWRRTVAPANMFDASDRQACRVRSSRTSTPLHALTTLNDPTWVEASRVLAGELLQMKLSSDQDRLDECFERVLSRTPTEFESKRLLAALNTQRELFRGNSEQAEQLLQIGEAPLAENLDAIEHAALTVLCLGILNLDEALTRQ